MIFLPPAVNAKCWVNSKYRRALETEFQGCGVQVCPYYYLMQTALGLETASKENTCFFFLPDMLSRPWLGCLSFTAVRQKGGYHPVSQLQC